MSGIILGTDKKATWDPAPGTKNLKKQLDIKQLKSKPMITGGDKDREEKENTGITKKNRGSPTEKG